VKLFEETHLLTFRTTACRELPCWLHAHCVSIEQHYVGHKPFKVVIYKCIQTKRYIAKNIEKRNGNNSKLILLVVSSTHFHIIIIIINSLNEQQNISLQSGTQQTQPDFVLQMDKYDSIS